MSPSSSSHRNPTTWDEYQGRASPPQESLVSSVLDEEQPVHDQEEGEGTAPIIRPRRRSSVTARLVAVADIGGVNSIRSFARSWQRAVGFAEVIPRQPSFVFAHDPAALDGSEESSGIQYGRSHFDRSLLPQTGLLRQHLQATTTTSSSFSSASSSFPRDNSRDSHRSHNASGEPSNKALDESRKPLLGNRGDDFRERESKALDAEMGGAALARTTSSRSSIFAIPPHLASPPVIGSYGSYRSTYGTIGEGAVLRARASSSGQLSASGRWIGGGDREDLGDEDDAAHGEHQPIMVKEVNQGDKVVLTVEGQSTLPQSIFNSINAIIGVGLLSLPLALKMSGWLFGLFLLTLTASVTAYTANLLARCMRHDHSLITYSDLAYVSFGTKARVVVSMLFTLELLAACVALVILFADSLHLLLPDLATANIWKLVCGVLILLLNAMPLRWLSYTSVIGIFSTFCIVCIVIVDGLVKTNSPGSLWKPATTYLFPSNWLSLPLAYGLLASPWGAHSVFPSIYRDMRHPYKWGSAVKVTFSFSYVLDTCLAIIGILMFGDDIRDAITSNILATAGYPRALKITMCIFVAIIPLTKIPLNARPLITTVDVIFRVHSHTQDPGVPRSQRIDTLVRCVIRLFIVVVLLVISIVFPAFDSVCAFLGAALCTLISIVLPISFYLKLFWREVSLKEKVVLWFLLVLFALLGLVGTIWTFLPKSLVGS